MLFNRFLITLPVSKSLGYFWNLGSMIFILFIFQLLTGIVLCFYYSNLSENSFDSVQYMMYNISHGWLFRLIHVNNCSMFMLIAYAHFFKGLFYSSYRLKLMWLSGLLLMYLLMLEAFSGYVLLWSQISYWAAVVITSFLSIIPYFGINIIWLIWGGYYVSNLTLKFFFTMHFLVPILLFLFILFHLFFLHKFGSTSKLMVHFMLEKITFFPYYWYKDLIGVFPIMIMFMLMMFFPYFSSDYESFIPANSMMSPIHIVPEWYFLFAFAILRCIDFKIMGIIMLLSSLMIMFMFLLINNYISILKSLNNMVVINFIYICLCLTYMGYCEITPPFMFISMILTFLYFLLCFFLIILNLLPIYIF